MAAPNLYCPPEEFTLRLRERIPMNVCFTFTSEQLDALRRAFGDRLDGKHQIDKRTQVHLPWSRYYLVFQAGRERRKDFRRIVPDSRKRTVVDSSLCGLSIVGLLAGAGWLAIHLI